MAAKVKSPSGTVRAYLRISKRKDESQSIDQQKHKIAKWADYQHEGWPVEWYLDEGVSATKKVRRPERDRALKELVRGDALVAMKVDRLARSVSDLLDIVSVAEQRGASVVFTDQGIDTAGPYGKFTLTLLGALAELEAGIIRERVTAAYETFDREGRHGYGLVPFGFESVRDADNGGKFLQPHPEDGPRLRSALLAIIDGASQMSQAADLGLSQNGFNKLVRNPRIYGKQPGGKVIPESGVITMSEWQALQARLRGPTTWSRTPGYGPVVFCKGCGKRMYLNVGKNPAHGGAYGCKGLGHTPRVHIVRDVVDQAIEKYFLDTWGPVPVFQADAEGDDTERQERLAAVEIELHELGAAISAPDADIASIASQAQDLQQKRESILQEPVEEDLHMRGWEGGNAADLWASYDDSARVELLRPLLRVTIHPPAKNGKPEARVKIQDLVPRPERFEWSKDKWRGRGFMVIPGEGVSRQDRRFQDLLERFQGEHLHSHPVEMA